MPVLSTSRISIEVEGRIHVGLISMHEGSRRINGGVGFGVRGISAIVQGTKANMISLVDDRCGPFSASELQAIHERLLAASEMRNWSNGAEIRISGNLKTHVGLGSGTALRLAAIEVLALLNDDPISRGDLIELSGRGGTSGIGIHTYFDGGLFLDLGVVRGERSFGPSSQIQPSKVPRVLPRLTLADWGMIICLPHNIATKSQAEEVEFFAKTAPIPEAGSNEAAYIALFDIYASAMDSDYEGFCQGIMRMQHTHWKAAEIRQYGDQLLKLMNQLYELGTDCCGLSSLGPTVFALGSNDVIRKICGMANELESVVIALSPTASGRRVMSS